MRPAIKIIGWGLALLCLAGLALFLLARVLITPERVRQAVVPVVEQVFERPVEIGEVDIDLFSGITLDKLVVPDKGGGAWLQVDRVVLRYRFWALLTGRLLIDRVRLEHPVARLQRTAAGAWNFAGLPASAEQDAAVAPPTSPVPAPGDRDRDDGLPFQLLIRAVDVTDGQLNVTDRRLNPRAPYRFVLRDINFRAQNLSLEKPFQIAVSLELNGGRIELDGLLDPQRRKHDLQLRFTDFDLAPLSPYGKDLLPGIFSRAQLEGKLLFAGNRKDFNLGGELRLQQVYLELDALRNLPIQNAVLVIAPDLNVNRTTGLVTIGPTLISYNGISVRIQGALDHLDKVPRAELRLSWQGQDIRDILNALPAGLLPQLGQLDPAGKLSGSLGLRGPLDDPASLLQAGELTLDAVQVNLGHLRPALSGTLQLVGHGLASRELQLRIGDETALLQLAIKDVTQKPLQLQSRFSAETFNFDKVFPATSPPGDTAASRDGGPGAVVPVDQGTHPVVSGSDEEPGPIEIPLVADGSVAVGAGMISGLEIKNLQLDYHLADNRLQIRRLSADLADGKINSSGEIDLGKKGFAYRTDLQLQNMAVAPLLQALLPGMAGHLSGLLSLQGTFSGMGVTRASLQRKLQGQGKLSLQDGIADGTRLSRGLVALLGLDQLRKIEMHQAEGTFKIVAGKALVKGVIAGRDLRMAPEGSIRFGGRVDLALPTSLAPAVAAKLDRRGLFGRLLKDEQGWTLLPLKIEGTFDDPKVGLDSRRLGRMAEKQLIRKLEKKLQKKTGSSDTTGGDSLPEKLLKDTLRGLLGE